MGIQCRNCVAGLEHCHGTVIHHAAHRAECTETGCEMPEAEHTFRVDCEAIGCACGHSSEDVASAHRVG
jgi:hypothetical protein